MFAKLPHILLGGAMGGGATVAYVLAEKEPKALIDTFQRWGPASFISLVALVLFSQFAEKILQVARENASSQQQLADAVREMVNKDDREKEEQRRLLSYVGSQQEKILSSLEELRQERKSRGASA
jgi:Sec-independent protein translocase protein TatA